VPLEASPGVRWPLNLVDAGRRMRGAEPEPMLALRGGRLDGAGRAGGGVVAALLLLVLLLQPPNRGVVGR